MSAMRVHSRVLPALLASAGLACGAPPPASETAADTFFDRLGSLCGQAFAGRITANEPPAPNDPFVGQPLVMHVRECTATAVRIPFHVGEDHSRTWVISKTEQGLRLKHDHRHEDGSPDVVTMYGGDAVEGGTPTRQAFPVDAETRALFEQQNLTASLTNTWAIELEPGRRFVYELSRPGRLFRVEFDLSQPVDAPPPPWGAGPGR
jgi:hypothetical protein